MDHLGVVTRVAARRVEERDDRQAQHAEQIETEEVAVERRRRHQVVGVARGIHEQAEPAAVAGDDESPD